MEYTGTQYGRRSALPIPDDIDVGDLVEEPESGEQYMLRVRLEAEAGPKVVVAANREQLLRNHANPVPVSEPLDADATKDVLLDLLQPSKEWLARFTQFFKREKEGFGQGLLRVNVPGGFSLPHSGQAGEWKRFCYTQENEFGSRTKLFALASMDHPTTLRLLKWMGSWIAIDRLRRDEGMWMWYLILRLDGLLDQDDMHSLRDLCRKLKLVRRNIGRSVDQSSENPLAHRADEVAAINILITSITRGYCQADLEHE